MVSRRDFVRQLAVAAMSAVPPAPFFASQPGKRLIVDSQVHIWRAHTETRPWAIPNGTPQMPTPFTIEQLLPMMDAAGVDRVVLVPPSWYGAAQGNAYCEEVVKAHPGRFGYVALGLAIDRPDQAGRLTALKHTPGVFGARVALDRAAIGNGSADWFWSAAEKVELPIFFLGNNDLAAPIAERHPGLTLIVDHMGISEAFMKANPDWGNEIDRVVVGLAKFKNVSVKVSSIPFLSSQGYPWRDIIPHVQRCYDAFGPDRCHWGTDLTHSFPKATYTQRITQFTEELPFLSEHDKDLIMGRSLLQRLRWK